VPAARPSACGSRRGAGSVSGRVSARSAGSVSSTATGRNGSSSTNTQRQLSWSAMKPANAGPASDGSTHADDSSASIRPYISRGYARLADAYVTTPSAPAPSPSSARPSSSSVHEPATAASTLPTVNEAIAARYARPGPARSAVWPAATEPIRLASMNALNAQP
jgi:hypothetical protein